MFGTRWHQLRSSWRCPIPSVKLRVMPTRWLVKTHERWRWPVTKSANCWNMLKFSVQNVPMSRCSMNMVQFNSLVWESKLKKCERYLGRHLTTQQSGRKLCHSIAAGFNLKQGWPQEKRSNRIMWPFAKIKDCDRGVLARDTFAFLHLPSWKCPTMYLTQSVFAIKALWNISDEKAVGLIKQHSHEGRKIQSWMVACAFASLAERACRCYQQTPLHMWWPGWKQALEIWCWSSTKKGQKDSSTWYANMGIKDSRIKSLLLLLWHSCLVNWPRFH